MQRRTLCKFWSRNEKLPICYANICIILFVCFLFRSSGRIAWRQRLSDRHLRVFQWIELFLSVECSQCAPVKTEVSNGHLGSHQWFKNVYWTKTFSLKTNLRYFFFSLHGWKEKVNDLHWNGAFCIPERDEMQAGVEISRSETPLAFISRFNTGINMVDIQSKLNF